MKQTHVVEERTKTNPKSADRYKVVRLAVVFLGAVLLVLAIGAVVLQYKDGEPAYPILLLIPAVATSLAALAVGLHGKSGNGNGNGLL